MNLLKMKNDQEEFKDYQDSGFEPVQTEDGSFTLKQRGVGEEMHARGGAVLESFYIYYDALKYFFESCQEGEEVEVISIGLGMGYNEILTAHAVESLKLNQNMNIEVKVLSYEKEEALKPLFLKRVANPENYNLFWKPFLEREVNTLTTKGFLDENLILKASFEESSFKDLENNKKIILFDAYSNKTSGELWAESFLEKFFEKCKPGSVVTTYAATGALNRVLKKTGFKNLKRKGFSGKRGSTLAVRA